MSGQSQRPVGPVYLVGAGPGDSGLITLRGVECLRQAELVLYDYLVNPQIVHHAPPSAEKICLGHHGRTRIWSQREINEKMVAAALAGQTVVRLKGGDPAVFARAAEEVDALVEHAVPFEIVPGVTAALAAGSYAGIPLTHRDASSAVALVTGQEVAGKTTSGLDYQRLARFPGTLVFYMGVTTVATWVEQLLAGGMSTDTPAVVVRSCSLPSQQTTSCTVGQLPDLLGGPNRIRPPAIVVIGKVAALPRIANWYERLPLFGQTVLITRPADQAAGLAAQLQRQGAEVLLQPAIEVREPVDGGPTTAVMDQLTLFDWIVFSSANGVHAFMRRLLDRRRDLRALGDVQLAVIGPATRDALRHYHLQADCMPQRFQAEDLAAELTGEAAGKRFLLVRASRGREVLAQQLTAAGGHVDQVVFYESVDILQPQAEVSEALRDGNVHWTTVTSSAIARSLAQLFGESLQKTRLVSISPVTSATLRELGYEPAAEAAEATMEGVLQAIVTAGDRE